MYVIDGIHKLMNKVIPNERDIKFQISYYLRHTNKRFCVK